MVGKWPMASSNIAHCYCIVIVNIAPHIIVTVEDRVAIFHFFSLCIKLWYKF